MNFITATCPACDGSGVEVFGVTVYEHGCGFSHPSTDERPCGQCAGEGVIEVAVELITIADLERIPSACDPF